MPGLYRSTEARDRIRAWCTDRLDAWPVAHTRTTVSTTLGETAVVSAGTGEDVCVYLPGTNFNAATSTGVLGALAERCRVIAVDLPGQPGLSSEGRPDRDEVSGYAQWIRELLRWCEAENPGGRVVLAAPRPMTPNAHPADRPGARSNVPKRVSGPGSPPRSPCGSPARPRTWTARASASLPRTGQAAGPAGPAGPTGPPAFGPGKGPPRGTSRSGR